MAHKLRPYLGAADRAAGTSTGHAGHGGVVRIGREAGYGKLTAAIEEALDLGCADVAAIRHLMMSDQLSHTVGEAVDIGSLSTYERPLPTMIEYDQLFSANVQAVQA